MNEDEVLEAATEFVAEYLKREPEFIDIAEFVDENYAGLGDADEYANVYGEVVAQLGIAFELWSNWD